MLYIDVIVEGVKLKAFVDSGAQATIMSADCAERTGLTRLLDTSYAGMARGVGTAPILGRVHAAPLTIASASLYCSFTVMAGKDVDLLLGLDMLKRHQANINLRKNVLEIADIEVPFLPESEIPKTDLQLGNEPTVEGPGGAQIGAKSGAVLAPGEAVRSAPGASDGWSSVQGAHPLPPTPASAPQRSAPPGGTPQPARQAVAQPPSGGGAEFPRGAIDAVMNISGVSEQEAVQALRAAGGDVNAAAGMFFGD
jgi:DNA damage-inducible protein 1